MSSKSYHGEDNPVKEERLNILSYTERSYHALRLLPHILSTLEEANAEVIEWRFYKRDEEARVYVFNAPELVKWGNERNLRPALSVRTDTAYPFEVYYLVDGVRVFSIMGEREKEMLFPY